MSDQVKTRIIKKNLFDYCRNVTNIKGDDFVGIKSELVNDEYKITVNFPIGYSISKEEKNVRKEIFDLFSILQSYNSRQSEVAQMSSEQVLKTIRFPVQAYLRVMRHYLHYGFYKDTEENYQLGLCGPVSMSRTISRVQPIVQKSGFVFPNLIVRKNNDTDKEIITEINRYCVYESYLKIGWLYNQKLPPQPNIKNPNLKAYAIVLKQRLVNTNKDSIKQLFQSMLAIIEFRNSADNPNEFYFGTNKFAYVWEKLIDATYGIENKRDYFPKTNWKLRFPESKTINNPVIEPDTIMLYDDKIFVLDAKYYKYGITKNDQDLPKSTDINKQISYAEYIATNDKFKKYAFNEKCILNAFIMPFNKEFNEFSTNDTYISIGEAVADWKQGGNDYEHIQGILIDVKTLMSISTRPNRKEIENLSKAIEDSLKMFNSN